jgi:putative Mg2+ transporter-C (MgtC) family protein
LNWQDLNVIIPLLVSALLGGLVGYERERANRPAGLRTHILVCLGSTLIMMVSVDMFRMYRGATPVDPGRIAAQVVSGIGFLGAGTILREGPTIRGLTTAASLWVVAGVGLAVGAGLYGAAVATVLIILITLETLQKVERRFISRGNHRVLLVRIKDSPGRLGAVALAMGQHGINIKNIEMRPGKTPEQLELEFFIRVPPRIDFSRLLHDLLNSEGVVGVELEE